MFTYLVLTLFILPIFHAEQRFQTELDDTQDILLARSLAANYLFGQPIRRFQNQVFNSPIDSSSLLGLSDHDNQQQQPLPQRAKRIYWENLAFHAADYNQKAKKI